MVGSGRSVGRQERRQGSLMLVLSFILLFGIVPTLFGRLKSPKKSFWNSSSSESKMLWKLFCRLRSSTILECDSYYWIELGSGFNQNSANLRDTRAACIKPRVLRMKHLIRSVITIIIQRHEETVHDSKVSYDRIFSRSLKMININIISSFLHSYVGFAVVLTESCACVSKFLPQSIILLSGNHC